MTPTLVLFQVLIIPQGNPAQAKHVSVSVALPALDIDGISFCAWNFALSVTLAGVLQHLAVLRAFSHLSNPPLAGPSIDWTYHISLFL